MKRAALILLGLALLGAGCAKSTPEAETEDQMVAESLEHRGIDASLSLMAFDQTAESYLTYLELTGDAPSEEGFEAWLEAQGVARDMFAQEIRLRTEKEGYITLYTEGSDGELQTDDDYWKHYSTAHVTTTGDLQ